MNNLPSFAYLLDFLEGLNDPAVRDAAMKGLNEPLFSKSFGGVFSRKMQLEEAKKVANNFSLVQCK